MISVNTEYLGRWEEDLDAENGGVRKHITLLHLPALRCQLPHTLTRLSINLNWTLFLYGFDFLDCRKNRLAGQHILDHPDQTTIVTDQEMQAYIVYCNKHLDGNK